MIPDSGHMLYSFVLARNLFQIPFHTVLDCALARAMRGLGQSCVGKRLATKKPAGGSGGVGYFTLGLFQEFPSA
jgi:hypothetical protein